jgi:predicted hydrolase (HD superfamily)
MYRFFARGMMEEYGNVEVTPMQLDELPEEILEQVKQTNAAAGEQEAD